MTATATEKAPLFETAQGQAFGSSGVQGFVNESPINVDPNAVSPNAKRWMFNPFSRIYVAERPITGHLFLNPGVFIPIQSQTQLISTGGISSAPGKAFNWSQPDATPQVEGIATPGATRAGYRAEIRSANAIATELQAAYSDRGVVILNSLTKFDDVAAVSALHRALVEPGLIYNEDPYFPEHPIPDLIALESYLANTATRDAKELADENLTINPSQLVTELLGAVRQAINLCRTVTQDAQRVIANRTKGYVHAFDAWHARCFIALGQKVPSDLPYERMQAVTQAPSVQSSTSEIERLRAENEALRRDALERENAELRRQLDEAQAGKSIVIENNTLNTGTAETSAEKIVPKCSFIKANGEQCKGRAGADGRCASHPLETTEQGDQENGHEEVNS